VLVLSRHQGERILIGDNIEVFVVSIDRGVVRLGISAPKDVPVHREEVYDRMHDPKQQGNVVYVKRADLERLHQMDLRGHVVLDFTYLTSITSEGLGTLVGLNRRLRERGGSLTLKNLQPFVLEVFQATKLDGLLQIEAGVRAR
jgi:carbon storage regulator